MYIRDSSRDNCMAGGHNNNNSNNAVSRPTPPPLQPQKQQRCRQRATWNKANPVTILKPVTILARGVGDTQRHNTKKRKRSAAAREEAAANQFLHRMHTRHAQRLKAREQLQVQYQAQQAFQKEIVALGKGHVHKQRTGNQRKLTTTAVAAPIDENKAPHRSEAATITAAQGNKQQAGMSMATAMAARAAAKHCLGKARTIHEDIEEEKFQTSAKDAAMDAILTTTAASAAAAAAHVTCDAPAERSMHSLLVTVPQIGGSTPFAKTANDALFDIDCAIGMLERMEECESIRMSECIPTPPVVAGSQRCIQKQQPSHMVEQVSSMQPNQQAATEMTPLDSFALNECVNAARSQYAQYLATFSPVSTCAAAGVAAAATVAGTNDGDMSVSAALQEEDSVICSLHAVFEEGMKGGRRRSLERQSPPLPPPPPHHGEGNGGSGKDVNATVVSSPVGSGLARSFYMIV